VHGIPSGRRVLADGDLVGLDFGVVMDGFFGDAARTVAVGAPSEQAARLMAAARDGLAAGIAAARPGAHVGDIGAAVQALVEARGFSVVRDFVGHGIGRRLHEPPHVPNFGRAGTGELLRPGMVLAIEPMVNAGGPEVEVLDDGWTAVTSDGSLSAHFEHTVAVTEKGPEILTLPAGADSRPGGAD
jgi:methionyl aminopeptidase